MKVAVVGSGPTGVTTATALLARGVAVDMFDVGHDPEPAADELAAKLRANPTDPALRRALKQSAPKAQRGVLSALQLALARQAPPEMVEKTRFGSAFVFRDVAAKLPIDGANVPRSLARGGLSHVWGSSCYPLRPEDYRRWPVSEATMLPHYRVAAELLGLEEVRDGLAASYPIYTPGTPPTPVVSRTAATLLAGWERHAARLDPAGIRFGRARTAIRKRDAVPASTATIADLDAGRVGCQRCGLCLSGCPWDAIYRSTRTLVELQQTPGFTYRPGFLVQQVQESERGSFVVATEPVGPYDAVFLAAGAVSSLRIAANSLGAHGRPRAMFDNNMYLVPSLHVRAASTPGQGGAFALSEAAVTMTEEAVAGGGTHLQLYSYGELGHLAGLPAPIRAVTDPLLARLVMVFVYLHSDDSLQSTATVVPGPDGSRVRFATETQARSREVVGRALRLWRRHWRAFGLWPIVKISTGLGFSGHLSGGLPMRQTPGPLDTHIDGRVEGSRCLYAVDASNFPFLPPQNPTYTAMANAHRIATEWAARARG